MRTLVRLIRSPKSSVTTFSGSQVRIGGVCDDDGYDDDDDDGDDDDGDGGGDEDGDGDLGDGDDDDDDVVDDEDGDDDHAVRFPDSTRGHEVRTLVRLIRSPKSSLTTFSGSQNVNQSAGMHSLAEHNVNRSAEMYHDWRTQSSNHSLETHRSRDHKMPTIPRTP